MYNFPYLPGRSSNGEEYTPKNWKKRITTTLFRMYCVYDWLMYKGCPTNRGIDSRQSLDFISSVPVLRAAKKNKIWYWCQAY